MHTKTITFEDLDGKKITETFYFNLRKDEIVEINFSKPGGMEKWLQGLLEKQKVDEGHLEMIQFIKDLIAKSVGRRSEDGKSFLKDDEFAKSFMQSDAYTSLFFELMENADKAAEFFNALMPADLLKKAQAEQEKHEGTEQLSVQEMVDLPEDKFNELVGDDPTKMSRDQLLAAMARKTKSTTPVA